jgi:hypothetical protein
MLDNTANKESTAPAGKLGPRFQPAAEAEKEVQANLPHVRLVHASYEAKGLPATWLCTLHDREFRAKASSLARSGNIGCPDCIEQRGA